MAWKRNRNSHFKTGKVLRTSNKVMKICKDDFNPPDPIWATSERKNELNVDKEDEHIGGGFNSLEEIMDALPEFLKKEKIKDIDGYRPEDELYDP